MSNITARSKPLLDKTTNCRQVTHIRFNSNNNVSL